MLHTMEVTTRAGAAATRSPVAVTVAAAVPPAVAAVAYVVFELIGWQVQPGFGALEQWLLAACGTMLALLGSALTLSRPPAVPRAVPAALVGSWILLCIAVFPPRIAFL